MIKEAHVHDFKPHTKAVRLHNYRKEQGVQIAIDMTAVDTLKQLVCACGVTTTNDLERKKL